MNERRVLALQSIKNDFLKHFELFIVDRARFLCFVDFFFLLEDMEMSYELNWRRPIKNNRFRLHYGVALCAIANAKLPMLPACPASRRVQRKIEYYYSSKSK